MTTDCNGRYVYLDPEVGGRIAVAEAARNVVCSGAEPLAITDNLNFGSPDKPEIFWQLEKSADGMAEACRFLDTPVIGGNVSFTTRTPKARSTRRRSSAWLVLFMTSTISRRKASKTKATSSFLLGETKAELGGSEFQYVIHGVTEGRPPELDLAAEKRCKMRC